jgi:heme exporter protein B
MLINPAASAMLKRDLLLAYRGRNEFLNPLFFFLIVITLFPLGVSPEHKILSQIAPGILWVTALLANLMSLDQLFKYDQEDGSLEQILLSPQPLFLVVLAKVLAQWLVTGLPLTILAPLLSFMLFLPKGSLSVLLMSLLLGTPLLVLIGAIGAALTLKVKRGGLLLSLLVLPLYIPVLVLGSGAVTAVIAGFSALAPLLWLAVLLVLGITFAPFAISAALRIGN